MEQLMSGDFHPMIQIDGCDSIASDSAQNHKDSNLEIIDSKNCANVEHSMQNSHNEISQKDMHCETGSGNIDLIIEKYRNQATENLKQYMKFKKFIHKIDNYEKQIQRSNKSMEEVLQKFEIYNKKIEENSSQLQIKQQLKTELASFISDSQISSRIIHTLLVDKISSPQFTQCLKEFILRLDDPFLQEYSESKALKELNTYLNSTKKKIISRIEPFLINKLQTIKKSLGGEYDYQVAQALIMKNENLYSFLIKYDNEKSSSLFNEYLSTIPLIIAKISDNFCSEFKPIFKEFHFSHFDCSNLKANRVNGNQQPLLLGNRHKIIYRQSFSDFKLNIKLLVERHRDNNSALTFEEVFLSINLNLIQMLEFEYIFLSEFFKISSDNALNLIKNLFSETINLFLNTNMEAIELCGDVTALLISSNLIRILPTKIYHKIVNKLLIAYWRELEKLIWFQIKELLSLHITSLKNARYKSMSVKKAEISPITRRYGEFTSSVIFITNTMTFSTLQRDMIRNWFHLSFKNFNNIIINIAEYSFTKNQEILAYVYRICNIGMLRNTLRSVCGTDLGQPGFYEVVFVNEMFQNTVEVYSHFILTESIGYVLKFVDANESIASPTIPEDIRQKLRDINLKFKNDWDKILKGLKIKVLSRFSENDLSRDVMNNVFDSFLNYYHRLHKIVDKIQDETLNPVPMLHQMILEVKRIKSDMK